MDVLTAKSDSKLLHSCVSEVGRSSTIDLQEALQQACVAMQAHPELCNLYTAGSETLTQALMRQAVSLLRQQQVPSAVEASRQAFDMVRQMRCLPLLHAQAAALHGRCCAVQTLLASQPAAKGEPQHAKMLEA